MGNATVIAELTGSRPWRPDPAGAGVPAGAGRYGLRWRGHAWGELAASRLSVQGIVAGR
jgi:hypothetical protein